MDMKDEITRLFYGPEEAFVEQSRQPLHVHPLFELAVEKQLAVRGIERGVSKKEIADLLVEMSEITDDLDECVIRSGMLDVPVVLSGDGIVLPTVEYQVGPNSVTIKSNDSGPDVEELGYTRESGGSFYGFGTRLDPITKNGAVVGVRPVIVYQVKVGGYQSPHSSGSVFVTGDVGKTQIEFVEDAETRRIAETLAILMEHDDETIIKAVNSINIALAKKKTVDASVLKHIGHQVDRILEGNADQKYIDAVIDLIGHYVDWTTRYSVETSSIIRVPRSNGGINGPAQLFQSETCTEYSGQVEQLVIRQNQQNIGGVLKDTPGSSVYAVSYSDDATWYTRLTDIKKFDSL